MKLFWYYIFPFLIRIPSFFEKNLFIFKVKVIEYGFIPIWKLTLML